jgi:hypothetical protein
MEQPDFIPDWTYPNSHYIPFSLNNTPFFRTIQSYIASTKLKHYSLHGIISLKEKVILCTKAYIHSSNARKKFVLMIN